MVRTALTGVLLLGVAACGGPPPETTPVPSFAGPGAAAGGSTAEPVREGLPADCAELISPADLGALMGLPLDSVTVRSTLGVAEPSVGRTERLACRYTATAAAGPARGVLLDLNSARYLDADAASRQWRTNTDVEDGDRREVPIGAASAALFDRSRDSTLMVTYAEYTLTFVLPARPLPVDRPRGDALVDLALRVLPAVSPPTTAAPPPPVDVVEPAVAAG